MSTRGRGRAKKSRVNRVTSNIYGMFSQEQIEEFKRAFDIIDYDHNLVIDVKDLMETYNSLGMLSVKENMCDEMLSEASSAVNFPTFLTLFAEQLAGTDPEETLLNAFRCFDAEGTDTVDANNLRDLLTGMGDRMTEEECDTIWKDIKLDKNSHLNYLDLTKLIKGGMKE